MSANLILAGLLAGTSLPVATEETPSADLLESRLRGCLIAGSTATDQSDLRAAVLQVRSLCGVQIARVRERRVADATRGLKGDAADAAEIRAVRTLNDEIAFAIASMTGLKL